MCERLKKKKLIFIISSRKSVTNIDAYFFFFKKKRKYMPNLVRDFLPLSTKKNLFKLVSSEISTIYIYKRNFLMQTLKKKKTLFTLVCGRNSATKCERN